jgi:hypothetical protein
LAEELATLGGELAEGHVAAWVEVLRRAPGPNRVVEAALIDARPGVALGSMAARLISAWRRTASDLPGLAVALALETAGQVHVVRETQRSTIVVSGPVSDVVPVRLTSEVAVEIVREATAALLVVSFAAYGVAEVVAELAAAADRGVRIDLVLETMADDGGTLSGTLGAAAAFRALEGKAKVWHWPQRHRPVVGQSRAALHAKFIAADERAVLLGSANLTDRALVHNLEVGAVLREPQAVQRLVRHVRALMHPELGQLEVVRKASGDAP